VTDSIARDAQKLTRGLIDFLIEVTQAAERNPELDILSAGPSWSLWWLEDLPAGAPPVDLALRSGVLMTMRPPVRSLAPTPSTELAEWLDTSVVADPHGDEPRLLSARAMPQTIADDVDALQADGLVTEPPDRIYREFEGWLDKWRTWAAERRRADALQPLYDFLEEVAKEIEQRDDEYELVLCRGLVRWTTPDGTLLRRHLVTEQLMPTVDRKTAEVAVASTGVSRRYEDSMLFGALQSYQHDRGGEIRQQAEDAFTSNQPSDEIMAHLGEWIGRCLNTEVRAASPDAQNREPGPILEISDTPALILRPRSKALLAEAYKHIARELKDPETPVAVALAQLVLDTEPEQRWQWIAHQGGVSGDFLGEDPRFPLDANAEQERVMELLRSETGVVVQGPPGTGKTHTIANLVSALLARGQRVLVTSQKDQALRVLRDKIPQELRHLCVLLAGGSKNAALELEQGLTALSAAVATSDRPALEREAQLLADERVGLRSEAARLNGQIRELREVENLRHHPVVPWYSTTDYSGTLGDIVREVKQKESQYDWLPRATGTSALEGSPPLTAEELIRLRGLLLSDSEQRQRRSGQWIPAAAELPSLGTFVKLITAESQAHAQATSQETAESRRLAALGDHDFAQLEQLGRDLTYWLLQLGFDESGVQRTAPDWAVRALNDLLAGRGQGLWGALLSVRQEAPRIQEQINTQGVNYVVRIKPIGAEQLGAARGALDAGTAFANYLYHGGKFKSGKWRVSREQTNAATFLGMVTVNGAVPTKYADVQAAVQRLEAEVSALLLIEQWANCGVEIAGERSAQTLSNLVDKSQELTYIDQILYLHEQLITLLAPTGLAPTVNSLSRITTILKAGTAALSQVRYQRLRNQVDALKQRVGGAAARTDACPELAQLLVALEDREAAAYEEGLVVIARAREEQAAANQLRDLRGRLRTAHPPLLARLEETAWDETWESRLPETPDAWAWRQAEQFILGKRTAEQERRLTRQYMKLEDQIQSVTARLAASEAMWHCLDRMTDDHARALRTYQEHMVNLGAGHTPRKRQFQAAARAAMEKAKTAVPAWVVPLPNLLENLPAERNSFDVVIVDEASQVGVEQLFLLWLAPRVIVVGDNKQCTPGENRLGKHERVFNQLDRYLGDADRDIQLLFSPKTNLYGLLSARSGKDAVVRLREHFRCVPEIINWSSNQFYELNGAPGLIPLRERRADDLPPLIVQPVSGGFTEGRDANIHNEIEAKLIAEQLQGCIQDRRYKGKTFGVVVLQGRRQVKVIEHEINTRLSPEVREERKIRVGVASDFQGDERDVVFLSMVVAKPPRAKKATTFRQAYNVAASRARDQLWLFSSVSLSDLNPEDLRASLMGYMQDPPSTYGRSPALDEVSDSTPCSPFESLLEQRVFREIKALGYYVVPQYAVGLSRLDLVVVGDGARVGVECDGHRFHTSPDQVLSDARRDRELSRMRWEVIRIRESEFEFDQQRELTPLWDALEQRGIRPSLAPSPDLSDGKGWTPVELPEDDEETDDADGDD
jgi:very-short-patch-repair endonuclease